MPRAIVRTIIFAGLASIGSFSMTFTFYLLFGLKEPRVAFALSSICPLIIAPPLIYWAFRNADRAAALNLELAVANAELAATKRSLEAMVRTDGLTGLLNRGAFFEALARPARPPAARCSCSTSTTSRTSMIVMAMRPATTCWC